MHLHNNCLFSSNLQEIKVKNNNVLGNGKSFTVTAGGVKIDEDGFECSKFSKPGVHFCVSVKRDSNGVELRGTEDVSLKTLSFTNSEWELFVKGVKSGQFDL